MLARLRILSFFLVLFVVGADAQGDKEPTLIDAPKPVYPKEVKDAKIGGLISLRITVGESGEVVSIDELTGPAQPCDSGKHDQLLKALRESVRQAIKQAKFSPAIKNGRPAKATIWLTSRFDPFDEGAGDQKEIVESGIITGKALRLPKPEYPSSARSSRAGGTVSVRVVIDESGKVFSAEAVSGHPLLRSAAVDAACDAKFSPTLLDGRPVRVSGVVTYNFMPGRFPL